MKPELFTFCYDEVYIKLRYIRTYSFLLIFKPNKIIIFRLIPFNWDHRLIFNMYEPYFYKKQHYYLYTVLSNPKPSFKPYLLQKQYYYIFQHPIPLKSSFITPFYDSFSILYTWQEKYTQLISFLYALFIFLYFKPITFIYIFIVLHLILTSITKEVNYCTLLRVFYYSLQFLAFFNLTLCIGLLVIDLYYYYFYKIFPNSFIGTLLKLIGGLFFKKSELHEDWTPKKQYYRIKNNSFDYIGDNYCLSTSTIYRCGNVLMVLLNTYSIALTKITIYPIIFPAYTGSDNDD